MSITRRTIIATVAALAMGGTMVASTPPADAHTYSKAGTVSAKEANKLFKETFKQRCLTVHEARHIAHGSGELSVYDDEASLIFEGTKKSHIDYIQLSIPDGGCADVIYVVKAS
jgi:hypothetical protein